MIVSVSGYNASGKTAMVEKLRTALEERGIAFNPLKFDNLYLSKRVSRKKKRTALPDITGSVGLRNIEGQRGGWNRRFGLRQLVDVVWAAVLVWVLHVWNRRRVVLFDRYFYDRFIHFDESGLLYRLARRIAPAPHLGVILLPDHRVWEGRILTRMHDRFGLTIDRLSEVDRLELEQVAKRYELFLSESTVIPIDSSRPDSFRIAVAKMMSAIDATRIIIPDEHGSVSLGEPSTSHAPDSVYSPQQPAEGKQAH